MSEIEDHIKRVSNKLQQLLKQYLFLQKENERLKESLKELQLAKAVKPPFQENRTPTFKRTYFHRN